MFGGKPKAQPASQPPLYQTADCPEGRSTNRQDLEGFCSLFLFPILNSVTDREKKKRGRENTKMKNKNNKKSR